MHAERKITVHSHKHTFTPYPPLRPCPQAQLFSPKNIKTYLSCPKKGTFGGLAGVALSRGRGIPGHWKKHSFTHSFFPTAQLFPPPCWLSYWLLCWLLCCCGVVVVVFVYFAAALPTPLPLPPPAHHHRCHCHRHRLAWRLTLSHCLGHWIERQKKSGTKIHHGLRRLPNTNKNTTTYQNHVGLMGNRWDMRRNHWGVQREHDSILLGQLSWDIA